MLSKIKTKIKRTSLVVPFILMKGLFQRPGSQNDEAVILHRLSRRYDLPKRFIEFGFSGWEFNCASLIRAWEGLLVDGDAYNVKIANLAYPRINAIQAWLTLDNLDFIIDYASSKPLGILSVDVDGNDYWFLEKMISITPALIIAEYNSSFGLRPVSVPYDPNFDRTKKHGSGTYFGASLTALNHLARLHGFTLIEISNTGINAYFVRNDLLTADDVVLKPEADFREKYFIDGSRPSDQWKKIKHLPLIDVTKMSFWKPA